MEQIELKEQIEEMKMETIMLANDIWDLEHSRSVKDNFWLAKELQRKGYRKQSEGEWVMQGLANPKCSVCNHYNRSSDTSDFCPNCGAHMKGEVNES